MLQAAEELDFEKAAVLRGPYQGVEGVAGVEGGGGEGPSGSGQGRRSGRDSGDVEAAGAASAAHAAGAVSAGHGREGAAKPHAGRPCQKLCEVVIRGRVGTYVRRNSR